MFLYIPHTTMTLQWQNWKKRRLRQQLLTRPYWPRWDNQAMQFQEGMCAWQQGVEKRAFWKIGAIGFWKIVVAMSSDEERWVAMTSDEWRGLGTIKESQKTKKTKNTQTFDQTKGQSSKRPTKNHQSNQTNNKERKRKKPQTRNLILKIMQLPIDRPRRLLC